ncbi:class I SAM-dependent methyltransferase [Paenibacillus dauci]|uniref:class I SAM-dependent methyltransferase n=1 Tax=Paenibacillus dauci TaxID=1567106 RepID=UPI000619CA31|nr:class I SAM-dependent methyltransferase [Paenibacillus dauci]
MCASFDTARESEAKYHEQFYKENELFESGSWISQPTPLVMELLERLLKYTPAPHVLDLACGVGRHAIPVAQQLTQGGQVTGVDLLEDAIDQLKQYAAKYEVEDRIQAITHDVENYSIEKDSYDYIIATGCLEHLSSEESFRRVLEHMQAGTRMGGIHFISMTSSVQQVEQETDKVEEGNIELNLSTERLLEILDESYAGWNILARKAVAQAIEENKDDKDIELRGNWVTYAVCREPEESKPDVLQQVKLEE